MEHYSFNISMTIFIMPDLFSCIVVTFSKWRPHLLKLFCIIKWVYSSFLNCLAKSKCLNCITLAGSKSVIAGSLSKLIFNQIHKSSELHFAQCSSESLLDSQLQYLQNLFSHYGYLHYVAQKCLPMSHAISLLSSHAIWPFQDSGCDWIVTGLFKLWPHHLLAVVEWKKCK